jgi:PAS domain S-box-containing protein
MLSHRNFQEVYNYSAAAAVGLDEDGLIVYANPKALELIFNRNNFLGEPIAKYIANQVHKDFFKSVLADQEFLLVCEGKQIDVLISSTAYSDHTGVTRTYLFIRDIGPLKKKENLLAYLNTATEALAQARDTKTALEQISKLIVPKFANWFSIDLLNDGKLQELILAHQDPEMIHWARQYRETYPTDLNGDSGAARVLRTGEPSYIPVINEMMILQSIPDPQQQKLLQLLNLQSSITVAVSNKEAIIGIISFISTVAGYYYDETDLRFAQNFASHIGLALENTRLNEAAANEISRRRHIESQLKITQGHLKSALSSGLVGTWIRDLNQNILYADESLSKMFGVPFMPEGCDPDVYQARIVGDDKDIANSVRDRSINNGDVYEVEYRVNNGNEIRWLFARGKTEHTDEGTPAFFTGVAIDITERKKAELALKENEGLFRFLANTIPHKMWTSDPDGTANYYNQQWYNYTGIDNFKELKEKVWDILHPEDRAKAEMEWPQAIAIGREMEMEHRLRRHDGQYRWHLSRFSAHRDEDGNIRLWVGTSTDIHDQKENEHRKDEFLSIASHELKTPLTSIKAFNQIIKRANPPAPLSSFIDKSAEHIFRLERLINDLLDVTKLNAGKMSYTIEPFSFRTMVMESIDNILYNTSHEIILEGAPEVTFTGDQFRLEQVMNNLLSNAIKYSPQAKKIVVGYKIEQDSIVLSVQDFGIGIAPENLDRLFDRYYRVDNTAMRFEGLGLGLYISSEILKRHKGSLWIESEQGKGSTFYFRLPLGNTDKNLQSVQKSDNFYADRHITIRFDGDHRLLDVDWTGFQDLASVQSGCAVILDYLKRHQVDRIVNNNSNVRGNWADAVEWVGSVWFPTMEQAGLKYFAHIFSPSTFSQLAAKKSIDIMAGIITTQYFTDIAQAREWIISRDAHN